MSKNYLWLERASLPSQTCAHHGVKTDTDAEVNTTTDDREMNITTDDAEMNTTTDVLMPIPINCYPI
jgi:predicted nuclease of predicted toxin-antitoxin system